MRAERSWQCRLFLGLAASSILLALCGPASTPMLCAAEASGSSPAGPEYRLVRVIIPKDAEYRKDARLNHPPYMYVMIYKNGEQLGNASQSVTGWECEFSARNGNNKWTIDDTSATYTVQIWDNQWGTDPQILAITGLTKSSFDSPILEQLSANDSQDRAVKLEFSRI